MSNNYTIYLVKIGNGPKRVASQPEINELIRRQESGEDINYQIFDQADSYLLFYSGNAQATIGPAQQANVLNSNPFEIIPNPNYQDGLRSPKEY